MRLISREMDICREIEERFIKVVKLISIESEKIILHRALTHSVEYTSIIEESWKKIVFFSDG